MTGRRPENPPSITDERCHKYHSHFCRDKNVFVATKMCFVYRDRNVFVATNIVVVATKVVFVACFCRDETSRL